MTTPASGLSTRPLGKTGVNVSILCFGGWHIGQPAVGDAEAVRIMQTAVDEGLTFFDNAWDYNDGRSEELMGTALATGGRREKVFLMTKNCGRDAATTRQHLEDSLRRLKTDVIDLWQFHEINYDNDPEWIVERGALAEALKAQKEGKVRFLGFTGHKAPHIFQKMIPVHTWATCQLPINVCDPFYRSSIKEVLPELHRRGIAPIGMKSLGGGNIDSGGAIVAGGVATVDECIRFSLSQEIASLVVGIDSMKVLEQDLAIARAFQPMSAEETSTLLARIKPVAGDGRFEHSKSTQNYDGPYHRQQHGFAA
ncbi:aldo/keto reductase [Fimbriiglobus ruber]|uniref:Ferredoxin n=1 Tax=Fimbriiglobus ruber TaxID=1908690 RepID=A0A225DQ92_9BACT|nr:aldo/keto reductase [Fimbriiglobus ruber]OWK43640.1 Ferredoxin [Fimbriiglobus ruber]